MRPAGSVEDRREVTLFFVTDLGLHTPRSIPDAILVHAASLETGRPLSGTEVAVLDELGRTVQSARTDGDGLVLVPGRPRPGQLLHARRGSQQAWLSLSQTVLDLSDFPVQGIQPSPWSVALWSGRDLYRPGETLRFDVLLRDRDGRLPGPLPPLFARLVQPDGRAVLERRLEPGPLGHFALALASGPDWPTGRWQLELRSDPTSAAPLAALPVHVQEFLPERLSLRLGLTPPAPAPGEPLALELTAAFLHGAPAAGERWELKRRLRAAEAALADRPGWRFGDLTASWPPAEEGVGEGELDPTGAARVNLEAPTGLPAPTAIELTATVLPAGGRPVSRRIAATVWPRAEMVGLEPAFPLGEGAAPNVPAQFAVQRFAHDGRMLGGEVELRLLRRHEEWLWIIQPQGGFEPRRELREEEIERRTLRIGAERPEAVSFQLDWGEYLLVARDAAGAETRLTFRVGWGGASGELKPDRVKLTLDRTGYRPGDTVELTVDPPYAGPGLLLLERDRPLLTRRFEARAGTRLKIELSPEMVGEDSYLSVLVLRPARSGLGPARALGVIPLPVDRGERAATVRLALPERMVPGETATVAVEVPELAGEEAYVVLHAVDEGTLGISGYRIPDPLAALFARRRFLAELRDLYGRLIEDLEGRLARLRFGGDAPTDLPLPQVTRPRAEVLIPDLRFGPVRLDGGGRAEIALPAPAWDGRLRVTAVAVAAARFGRAEGELVVRGPLLAELTAPRSLAPGDAARVAVVLHNPEARAQTVTVRLGTEGALGVEPGSFELTLAGGERRVLEAMLTAGSMHGTGAVRLAAEAEGFRLTRRSEARGAGGGPADTTQRRAPPEPPGEPSVAPRRPRRGARARERDRSPHRRRRPALPLRLGAGGAPPLPARLRRADHRPGLRPRRRRGRGRGRRGARAGARPGRGNAARGGPLRDVAGGVAGPPARHRPRRRAAPRRGRGGLRRPRGDAGAGARRARTRPAPGRAGLLGRRRPRGAALRLPRPCRLRPGPCRPLRIPHTLRELRAAARRRLLAACAVPARRGPASFGRAAARGGGAGRGAALPPATHGRATSARRSPTACGSPPSRPGTASASPSALAWEAFRELQGTSPRRHRRASAPSSSRPWSGWGSRLRPGRGRSRSSCATAASRGGSPAAPRSSRRSRPTCSAGCGSSPRGRRPWRPWWRSRACRSPPLPRSARGSRSPATTSAATARRLRTGPWPRASWSSRGCASPPSSPWTTC
ncbi:MAG: MG2 domain-containing protein [Xanthomonadales bacterium]|nr:MG2 domain-containing protein [Xanthomonadales bacterium]